MQVSSHHLRPPGVKTREFEYPAYSPVEFIRVLQVGTVLGTLYGLWLMGDVSMIAISLTSSYWTFVPWTCPVGHSVIVSSLRRHSTWHQRGADSTSQPLQVHNSAAIDSHTVFSCTGLRSTEQSLCNQNRWTLFYNSLCRFRIGRYQHMYWVDVPFCCCHFKGRAHHPTTISRGKPLQLIAYTIHVPSELNPPQVVPQDVHNIQTHAVTIAMLVSTMYTLITANLVHSLCPTTLSYRTMRWS